MLRLVIFSSSSIIRWSYKNFNVDYPSEEKYNNQRVRKLKNQKRPGINISTMKYRQKKVHMKVAYEYSKLSYCEDKKVGCVIVKNDNIISIGYNGTSPGEPNCCEDKHGNTLPDVIHAEENAIIKLAKTTGGALDASLFTTYAPCLACSRLIANSGITSVYYFEYNSKHPEGSEYLEKRGLWVEQILID